MSVFEKIQDRLSIIEVIEEYTPVIDRGNYCVALCPFHKEKRPSLSINKEKGVFYCFGCMATGNMFTFVTQIENISKKEALEKLALKAGVTLDDKLNNELDDGFKLLNSVASLYNKALEFYLKSDNYVSQYIANRKITSNTLDTFCIGYAPRDGFLLTFLDKNGISKELAYSVGLLTIKEGVYKDKFSDRMMIPIFNDYGKIVGFTARTFPNDVSGRPKYLNSPESKYFSKSRILYGLDKAKKNIQTNKKVILVEGNMDVITSHQYQLNYSIATQGTSTTLDHINKIKKLNCDLILAFDNDNAGRAAEHKVLKMALDNDINTFKMIIPTEYKDIDEYLQRIDINNIQTIPYLEFLITNSDNLTSDNLYTQKSAINYILELTNNSNPIIQAQSLALIHKKSNLDLGALQKLSSNKKNNLPELAYQAPQLDPIKASFYQLLALDINNSYLPIIYNALKDRLSPQANTYQEFISNEEIKWVIESKKLEIKEQDISPDINQAATNLLMVIKRNPELSPKLNGSEFKNLKYSLYE
jgi:DNA primase catalytic core